MAQSFGPAATAIHNAVVKLRYSLCPIMKSLLSIELTPSPSKQKNTVEAVAFSQDQQVVAVGRWPHVFLYQLSDGTCLQELDVSGPIDPSLDGEGDDYWPSTDIAQLEFSPDGTMLYVRIAAMISNNGDTFGAIQAHECEGGSLLWMYPEVDGAEISPVLGEEEGVTQLLVSPDGKYVAATGYGGFLLLDPRSGECLREVQWAPANPDDIDNADEPYDPLSCGQFSPDGAWLWVLWPMELRCYDCADGSLLRAVTLSEDQCQGHSSAAIIRINSAADRLVCLAGVNCEGFVYPSHRRKNTVTPVLPMSPERGNVLGFINDTTAALVSPRSSGKPGKTSAGPLSMITLSSGASVELKEPKGAPTKWTFSYLSPDGKLLARASGSTLWVSSVDALLG